MGMGHTRLGRGEEEDKYLVPRTRTPIYRGPVLVPELNLEVIEVDSRGRAKDSKDNRGRETRAERRVEKDNNSSSRTGVQMGTPMKT